MLYIEAPAGVGYSYSSSKNYTINDDEVIQLISVENHHGGKNLATLFACHY